MSPTATKVEVVMEDDHHVTKRTVRYASVDEDAPVTQLYLSKEAAAELGNPTSITLTIEAR